MEENLKKLLTLVKDVCDKHRQYKKGFNVITTFVKPHREVELHSRFITWLLDPKGPHGLGTLPLELFLKQLNSQFKVSKEKNKTEVVPNASNWTEDRDMDILIKGLVNEKEEECAIIIENKIYAKDSDKGENNGQLARYYFQVSNDVKVVDQHIQSTEILKWKPSKIELYYLTLDKHEPNKMEFETKDNSDSEKKVILHIGEDDKGITLISYIDNIEPWLNEIILSIYNDEKYLPTVELIQQYLDALHCVSPNVKLNQDLFTKLCSNKDESVVGTLQEFLHKHKDEINLQPEDIEKSLRDIVEEHLMASAIFILKNYKHIYWHAIDSFLNNLGNELRQLNIEVEGRSSHLAITDLLYHPSKHTPIYFRIKQNGIVWTLQADDRCREKGFFLGIDQETEPNKDNASEIQNLLSKIDSINPIVGWHTVKYLQGNTVEFNNENVVLPCLNFWDFTQWQTFNLLNEGERKKIAKQYAEFVKSELINLTKVGHLVT